MLDRDIETNGCAVSAGFQASAAGRGSLVLQVPSSPADLLDRIAILEVKVGRLTDPARCRNVARELGLLRQARDAAPVAWDRVARQVAELSALHALLWDAEDTFRGCAMQGDYGPDFVAAAQAVIAGNTRRAATKAAVNAALGSAFSEEKRYGNPVDRRPGHCRGWFQKDAEHE